MLGDRIFTSAVQRRPASHSSAGSSSMSAAAAVIASPSQPASSVHDTGITKRGWLEKEGGIIPSWKHRFFLLHRSTLYYFESEESCKKGLDAAKGNILISGAQMRLLERTEISSSRPYGISITPPLTRRTYLLAAANDEVRWEWYHILLQAGAHDDAGPPASVTAAAIVNAGGSGQFQKARPRVSIANNTSVAPAAIPQSSSTSSTSSAAHLRQTSASPAHPLTPGTSFSKSSSFHSTASGGGGTGQNSKSNSFNSLPPRMFSSSHHEGWLLKLGGISRNKFQSRYFVLLGAHLIYFNSSKIEERESSCKGTINIHDCAITQELNSQYVFGHPYVFSLLPKQIEKSSSSSLLSSIFGSSSSSNSKKNDKNNEKRKIVLVAKDETDLKQWLQAMKMEIDRDALGTREASDVSDSEENDPPPPNPPQQVRSTSGNGAIANDVPTTRPASTSTASPTEPFITPTGDVMSHCYKLDSSSTDDPTPTWKRRYCILDVNTKTLRVYKHQPHAGGSKPKVIELKNAHCNVSGMKCAKTKHHPSVLTITLPPSALDEDADDASRISSPSMTQQIHLAPSSQARFDEWYSMLLLSLHSLNNNGNGSGVSPEAAQKRKHKSKKEKSEKEKDEVAEQQDETETAAASTSSSKKKSRRHHSRHNSQHSESESAESSTASSSVAARPKPRASPSPPPSNSTDSIAEEVTESVASPSSAPITTQSQLLHAMSLVLDAEAMSNFRARSSELHHDHITPAIYFRFYFRTFGKGNGLKFWPALMKLMPRQDIRAELEQLYVAHMHLFQPEEEQEEEEEEEEEEENDEDDDDEEEDEDEEEEHDDEEDDEVVEPVSYSRPTSTKPTSSPSPAGSPSPAASPTSSRPSPSSSSASSFTSPRPTHHAASASMPASPAYGAPIFSPHAHHPPHHAVSTSSIVEPSVSAATREELNTRVDDWAKRGEHNIITLLCTLHEILPELCSAGQFIPFTDDAPTIKEVKQTHRRAMVVIHPDKVKTKAQTIQIRCESVCQAMQTAFQSYEKQVRKMEKKAAAAAGQ